MLSDDEFRNATVKKINNIEGGFVNSGFTGKDTETKENRLLANRHIPEGTLVTLRPNLRGWIVSEGSPPVLTQSVHNPREGGKYGKILGYDHIVAARGNVNLDVSQSGRTKIALSKEHKYPMECADGG